MADGVHGGAYADGYGEFVRKIFTPNKLTAKSLADMPVYADVVLEDEKPFMPDLPPGLLSKLEELEAREYSEEAKRIYSPLEFMYGLTDKKPTGDDMKAYRKYPVYQPKQSAEYYSTMYGNPQIEDSPAMQYKVSKTASVPNVWHPIAPSRKDMWHIKADSRRYVPPSSKSTNLFIDYKGYTSSPLSPHFYASSGSTMHNEDSRILGSDFVMVKTRPRDPFLNKVDKLLAECRSDAAKRWTS